MTRPALAPEPAPTTAPLLSVQGLARHYGTVPVFQGVDLQVRRGEFVAVVGESGVGKSTLLNCLAGLDRPDTGRVHLLGQDVHALSEPQQAGLRRRHLGFVFQAFHVLPHLDVHQNVALPLMLLGVDPAERDRRVAAVLDEVGLAQHAARLPAQLSGGQLQRVAIARALVHRPALVLADEPTGNLDPQTAARIIAVLRERMQAHDTACVLVTHSQAAAASADRIVRLTAQGMHPDTPLHGRPDAHQDA